MCKIIAFYDIKTTVCLNYLLRFSVLKLIDINTMAAGKWILGAKKPPTLFA